MAGFQMWLVRWFATFKTVSAFMQTKYGWPAAESIHFIGLSLLVGTIFLFDLRLLGMAKGIPIGVLHKLVPWGLLGYGLTVVTGIMFLMTEPDQYIYNPSFHLKMLFMAVAGFNALAFYVTSYRRVTALGAPADVPRLAKLIAAASLCLWLGVIVSGRLLTFYRPFPCGPEGPRFLSVCIPGYYR